MSASNEWAEWHLTPRGWEKGDHRYDFKPEIKVCKPSDAVCTYIYRESMSSGFSPLAKESRLEWSCGDKDKINGLIKNFGEAPRTL